MVGAPYTASVINLPERNISSIALEKLLKRRGRKTKTSNKKVNYQQPHFCTFNICCCLWSVLVPRESCNFASKENLNFCNPKVLLGKAILEFSQHILSGTEMHEPHSIKGEKKVKMYILQCAMFTKELWMMFTKPCKHKKKNSSADNRQTYVTTKIFSKMYMKLKKLQQTRARTRNCLGTRCKPRSQKIQIFFFFAKI